MIDYTKLIEYRSGLRPVSPDSLPAFVDRELRRISAVSIELLAAIKDLDARIAALEP